MSLTPICDFVNKYLRSGTLRAHMPGHKGLGGFGAEADITEIAGADELYEPEGIIRESEKIAARLFGAGKTLYSAEGSSLSIRAMLYLLLLNAKQQEKRERYFLLAVRNAHISLVSACSLLDLDIEWLWPEDASLLNCPVDPRALDEKLAGMTEKPIAVYLTSPDYLGNVQNIRDIALVCHWHGVLLAVDNAHGAYLRFLENDLHPITLGADICCDSAHKTLPCLTGAGYLHISRYALFLAENAERAMALFASTSPSYLILQSLDRANEYLSSGYREALRSFVPKLDALKERLAAKGFSLVGSEKLKLTLAPKGFGYTGTELAAFLRENGIECEAADPDYTVLMLTPETGEEGLLRIEKAFGLLERREASTEQPPALPRPERIMTVREAVLSPQQRLSAERAFGRIMGNGYCGCPPAVPIVVPGERIDEAALRCMRYYGFSACTVVK